MSLKQRKGSRREQAISSKYRVNGYWNPRRIIRVVISSRARLARNLPQLPFAPRASNEQLRQVMEQVTQALGRSPWFKEIRALRADGNPVAGTGIPAGKATLISAELEKRRCRAFE